MESGNKLYRDYIGSIFPYSLLSPSKFLVFQILLLKPKSKTAYLAWPHIPMYLYVCGLGLRVRAPTCANNPRDTTPTCYNKPGAELPKQ